MDPSEGDETLTNQNTPSEGDETLTNQNTPSEGDETLTNQNAFYNERLDLNVAQELVHLFDCIHG